MKYSINLLPQKEKPFYERIMYFFLNYLRYIIIITQLVVIGVFFYRFQIDQKIIDLKESVDQKKEIVQVVLPLLKEAEILDIRSSESKKIFNVQKKFNMMFEYFLSEFPEGLKLNKLEISPDSIKATGSTVDSMQLQAFFSVLKKDNKFGLIEIQNLRKTETGYSFILNISQFKDS